MDILLKQYFLRILGVRFGDIHTKTSIPNRSHWQQDWQKIPISEQKLRSRQRDKRTANQKNIS